MASPLSRQASSRPHGFHPEGEGRRTSHAPGLDRETRWDPRDGTNGVIMEAAATAEPDRSCTVIIHPLRGPTGPSLSLERVRLSQLSRLLAEETLYGVGIVLKSKIEQVMLAFHAKVINL
ncbi:PTS system glucose-specific EIICBA component [Striga asiatica]|uniref:PTS system glucose-specific EIICBA component n=1 Tax=Striga asiatica TaxID=4170 RepID=A0A5A7NXD7_STRAF|nr:PTS system glucose-specific EIICBA component [Striga asiatica]